MVVGSIHLSIVKLMNFVFALNSSRYNMFPKFKCMMDQLFSLTSKKEG